MFRALLSVSIGVLLGGGAAVLATSDLPPANSAPSARPPNLCPSMVPDYDPATLQASTSRQPDEVLPVIRLPARASEFEKYRAMVELAAAADSGKLQRLIFDASKIVDSGDRRAALLVLFGRLTEIDPRSALALAGLDGIGDDREILQRVWETWARSDLDGALQESVRLPKAFDREFAAQAMFSVYGYTQSTVLRRIETTTGISPDAENRRHFVYQLADESPASAFTRVLELDSAEEQHEAIADLAQYLARKIGIDALDYADLLMDPNDQYRYMVLAVRQLSVTDPQSTITALSSLQDPELRYTLLDGVIRQVTERDIYLAKQLADQLVDSRARDWAYVRVIQEHAYDDPVEAAGWAASITDPKLRWYAERPIQWVVE